MLACASASREKSRGTEHLRTLRESTEGQAEREQKHVSGIQESKCPMNLEQ